MQDSIAQPFAINVEGLIVRRFKGKDVERLFFDRTVRGLPENLSEEHVCGYSACGG